MNSFIILIPAILIYIATVYWLLTHFNYKDLWKPQQGSPTNKRLTVFIKRVLDFFLVVYTFIMIMWLPIMVVMGISQGQVSTWGMDISVFSGVKIDIDAIAGVTAEGLRHPQLSIQGLLSIDTSNVFAWYMFATNQLFSVMAAFYCVVLLRAIIISFQNNHPFTVSNGWRIRRIGIVVIAWSLANPFIQYFGWGAIIDDISFSSMGIQLYPAFQINTIALFIGVMMIILSGILNEAAEMSQEQELTI